MSTFDGIVKEFPHIRIDQFARNGAPPLACFLSHVHSDHLRGLEGYKSPFIYCSAATKELLLRLEKYPHRMNFAKGVLESRKQTYRHLKTLLRPIPLHTPTDIELAPGNVIRVTLFDANHCTGAVMFLIEGQGKAILYTGDIRSEQWWIDNLTRHPCLVPYAQGIKRLDNIYLDTTFASSSGPFKTFPPKADGVAELLRKVSEYPSDTIFYFHAWTFGYEEVWVALSNFLQTRIHLDRYRYRLYRSLGESQATDINNVAPLIGFQLGSAHSPGCLTHEDTGVRLHSCERGTRCHVFDNDKTVVITPIVTRYKGVDYAEMGAGGGQGDLDQIHELELWEIAAVGNLIEYCNQRLQDKPDLQQKVLAWLAKSVKQGGQNVRIDTAGFFEALYGDNEDADAIDNAPLDRLVNALEVLVAGKPKDEIPLARHISFPYSRHASYDELRALVAAFSPKELFPNTVEPGLDVDALFGDLLGNDASQRRQPGSTADNRSEKTPISKTPAKRVRPADGDHGGSAARRIKAYEAALGVGDRSWGTDIKLASVKSYHDQEPETEL